MIWHPFWDVLQVPGLGQSAEASTGAILAGSQHDYNRMEVISSITEMNARFDKGTRIEGSVGEEGEEKEDKQQEGAMDLPRERRQTLRGQTLALLPLSIQHFLNLVALSVYLCWSLFQSAEMSKVPDQKAYGMRQLGVGMGPRSQLWGRW